MNTIIVIIDRDGVINQSNATHKDGPYYVLKPEDFKFLPGAKQAIVKLYKKPYVRSVRFITMQNCISKGLATVKDIHKVNDKMRTAIRKASGYFVAPVEVCWGAKDKVSARTAQLSNIIYSANADPSDTFWFIDDSAYGIEAAKSLGMTTVHVRTPFGDQVAPGADYTITSLSEIVDLIMDVTFG